MRSTTYRCGEHDTPLVESVSRGFSYFRRRTYNPAGESLVPRVGVDERLRCGQCSKEFDRCYRIPHPVSALMMPLQLCGGITLPSSLHNIPASRYRLLILMVPTPIVQVYILRFALSRVLCLLHRHWHLFRSQSGLYDWCSETVRVSATGVGVAFSEYAVPFDFVSLRARL